MATEKATHILIAEDSRTQAGYIRCLLEEAHFKADVAANGKLAFDFLKEHRPDIIVTDLEMPVMNGLQLVEAVRRDYPSIPVVLVTAHGSEKVAALALRKGASSYVPKSVLEQFLVPTLNSILSVTQVERYQQQALEWMQESDSLFVLGNDTATIPPLLGYLDSLLTRLKFCDATGRMRVGVALHEALVNAMQHGNLEVSSELRQVDENIFRDKVRERREEAPYRERRVRFRVKLTPTEVAFAVRDEGPGFDPGQLPDPFDPANLERVGGRGLLLIRNFMDRVEHNDSGNEIVLVKRRDKVGEPTA